MLSKYNRNLLATILLNEVATRKIKIDFSNAFQDFQESWINNTLFLDNGALAIRMQDAKSDFPFDTEAFANLGDVKITDSSEKVIELIETLGDTLDRLASKVVVERKKSVSLWPIGDGVKPSKNWGTYGSRSTNWAAIDDRLSALEPGLVMLLGFTDGGKTTLLKKMASDTPLVRYGEPRETFDRPVLSCTSFDECMFICAVCVYFGIDVNVDSFRLLYSAVGGGSVTQGLNADFAYALTSVNNFLASMGNGRVIGAMNPIYALPPSYEDNMESRGKLIDTILYASKGSIAGLVYLANYRPEYITGRLSSDGGTRFTVDGAQHSGTSYSEDVSQTSEQINAMLEQTRETQADQDVIDALPLHNENLHIEVGEDERLIDTDENVYSFIESNIG